MVHSKILVNSEIGRLKKVILHRPGPEVEKMTPVTAERSLYSDILNLSIAHKEYSQLEELLKKTTTVYQVNDLLASVLKEEAIRQRFIREVTKLENLPELYHVLMNMNASHLADTIIEGVRLPVDNLTKYLSEDKFSLLPLPNFFFTRDASMSVFDSVFIGKMANKVREREALIMKYIFKYHNEVQGNLIDSDIFLPPKSQAKFEGGDVIVARKDVLLIGVGQRTSSQGVDFFIDRLKEREGVFHVIVQELPSVPESFIHLDMTFTFLKEDKCMAYKPLIMDDLKYRTIYIKIDNGNVKKIETVPNIIHQLNNLGFDLNPIYCGGGDEIYQEREQWHSGANFFALAPGKVVGYSRNNKTSEELSKNGFDIVHASEFLKSSKNIEDYKDVVFTIDGSELSRGGGGARCMTMPVERLQL